MPACMLAKNKKKRQSGNELNEKQYGLEISFNYSALTAEKCDNDRMVS